MALFHCLVKSKSLLPVFWSHYRSQTDLRVFSTTPTDKKKKGRSSDDALSDALVKFMDSAEAAKKMKVTFSPEEMENHARIAKEYQKNMWKRENKLGKELADKIWLQQEAIRALPPQLRAAAEIIDDSDPPPDRPWPAWDTPPIKNFDINAFSNLNFESTDE